MLWRRWKLLGEEWFLGFWQKWLRSSEDPAVEHDKCVWSELYSVVSWWFSCWPTLAENVDVTIKKYWAPTERSSSLSCRIWIWIWLAPWVPPKRETPVPQERRAASWFPSMVWHSRCGVRGAPSCPTCWLLCTAWSSSSFATATLNIIWGRKLLVPVSRKYEERRERGWS